MELIVDPAAERIIDEELEFLNREELEGIWRSLCAMMLLRTANLLHVGHHDRKQNACQKQTAMRWLNDGTGIITFSAACEGLDMDRDAVKRGLLQHAESRAKRPINKGTPGLIFGKYPCHQLQTKSKSCSSGHQPSIT
jgi:hypothetical protein